MIFGVFMTEKLYDKDAYLKEFTATVTGSFKEENGLFKIVLDKTAFFPEEGGQTPDKGTINDIDVLDVQIKEGVICHYLSMDIPVGTEVKGVIDWEHRYTNMQMHSGEHIFSGLVHREFGYDNVGFHLSDNTATMDYNGKLTKEDILRLEMLANRVIWENRKITASFPSSEELEKLDYRSKGPVNGPVRIVKIEGVDLCACCAPHVRLTGEIGLFKIVSFENYKGGVRLNFLSGKRAFLDYERLNDIEIKLSQSLNVKKEDILSSVDKLLKTAAELEYSNTALRRKEVESLCKNSSSGVLFLEKENTDLLRFTMDELKKHLSCVCVVFAGNDAEGYRFLAEYDKEGLNELLEGFKGTFNAKGGGKSGSIQGTLYGKREDIVLFLKDRFENMFGNLS